MGANTRTYKFALGGALMEQARAGRQDLRLSELAGPYVMSLLEHLQVAPQAPAGRSLGESDFLAIAGHEAAESKALGQPTERLLNAAVRSMPGMVMEKFHNLGGGTEVGQRFYETTGGGGERVVRLTPALHAVVQGEQVGNLGAELAARWNIVESSFLVGVGRSLIQEGLFVDWPTLRVTDRLRRRSVAGVAEAVIGFQDGRCLICGDELVLGDGVAVDHVFPLSLMKLKVLGGSWPGPDLDSIWNLAPAHVWCNASKSDRLPTLSERRALADRNAAIMGSPHPLRRTLQLTLTGFQPAGKQDWFTFAGNLLNDL